MGGVDQQVSEVLVFLQTINTGHRAPCGGGCEIKVQSARSRFVETAEFKKKEASNTREIILD